MARSSPTVSRRLLSLLERGLPPVLLADSERRRRALLIAGTVWALVIACTASFPVLAAVTSGPGRIVSLGANASVIALALAGLALLRNAATPRLAGNWVAGLMFAGIACGVIVNGGFTSPYWILLAIVPFMASQMAGRGAGLTWAVVDLAFIAAIFALDLLGVALPQFHDVRADAATAAIYSGMAVLAIYLLSNLADLAKEDAIARAEQFSTELARSTKEVAEARVLAEQAVAANEAKSAFMATMSHELRTPLNAVIGYAELLVEDAESHGLPMMRNDLIKIVGASQHLLALIEDILDLSRVEAERLDLRSERFAAEDLVYEVTGALEPLARKRKNVLEVVFAGPTIVADLDRARVRQVLVNLVSNAIKFTSQGRVAVHARAEHEDLRRWLVLVVEDTGIGISEADQRRIFDAFTQVDSSPSRRYEGSGLGLALCKRLVEMMGGTIAVRSQLGKGSAFTVRLPAAPPARAQPGPLDVAC